MVLCACNGTKVPPPADRRDLPAESANAASASMPQVVSAAADGVGVRATGETLPTARWWDSEIFPTMVPSAPASAG